jgi:hypothetical protein
VSRPAARQGPVGDCAAGRLVTTPAMVAHRACQRRPATERPESRASGDGGSRSSGVKDQFGRDGDDVHHGVVPHCSERQRATDGVGQHQLLQGLRARDRTIAGAQEHVTGEQAGLVGRSTLDYLGDSQPGSLPALVGEGGRKRDWIAGQAEIGPPHPAFIHQCGDDLTGRRVDRNSETQTGCGPRTFRSIWGMVKFTSIG